MASTILSDNGVSSGSAGIKTTADSTGALALQTTTAGGAATTAVTIDTSQNTTLAGTLTTSSRGIAKASMPAGSVLQVVNGITPSNYTTASTSSTATGYGLSITPTASSSKIMILLTGAMDSGVVNNQAVVSIRRGATDLGSGASNGGVFSSGGRVIGSPSVMFLDSPATTSATTYNIYFNCGSSSTITWYAGATVTLMEIAA